jgi:hypothetical protein
MRVKLFLLSAATGALTSINIVLQREIRQSQNEKAQAVKRQQIQQSAEDMLARLNGYQR